MVIEKWQTECKTSKDQIHSWSKDKQGFAQCNYCHVKLNLQETRNCYGENNGN